jgi:hypothetical protein
MDDGENCIFMNHGLYSSPHAVRVIKSGGMKWVGNVVMHGGGERCLQGFGWEAQR